MALATMASERLERKISGEVEEVEEVEEEVVGGSGRRGGVTAKPSKDMYARTHAHEKSGYSTVRFGAMDQRWVV